MRPRFTRIPRWAWLASAAVHATVAVGLYLLLQAEAPKPAVAVAKSEPLQLSLAGPADEPPSDAIPLPQPAPRIEAPPAPPAPLTPSAPGRMPTLATVPGAIPSDFQARIRDLAARPTPALAPADFPIPSLPSDIRPVEHVAPRPTPPDPKPPKFAGGTALHGPLPADVVAVYLLDCSASMGLNRDTFDAARAALVATMAATPRGTKFQVLAYSGEVAPLLRGTGGKLLASDDATARKVMDAVAELKAEGRSAHEAALRAAKNLGADTVVWITDAGADELAKCLRVLRGGKPVTVYAARAANGTVAEPIGVRE